MSFVIKVKARIEPSAALRCAYCHGSAEGPLSRCEACGVLTHTDCREALRRCATLGCAERERRPSRVRPRPETLWVCVCWIGGLLAAAALAGHIGAFLVQNALGSG